VRRKTIVKTSTKPRPALFLLCGLPFSGKTTTARRISEELGWELIDHDAIHGEPMVARKVAAGADSWILVSKICQQRIAAALKNGQGVIYDSTNTRIEHRQVYQHIARRHQASYGVIFLDVSMNVIRRRRARNARIPQRHQVSDENFDNAVAQLQRPDQSEKLVIIRGRAELNRWIKQQQQSRTSRLTRRGERRQAAGAALLKADKRCATDSIVRSEA
jgi:predicted kinase